MTNYFKPVFTIANRMAASLTRVEDSRLIARPAEAYPHARANGSAPPKDLIDSPSFLPFRINPGHPNVLVQGRVNPRQDSVRWSKLTRPGRLSPSIPLN